MWIYCINKFSLFYLYLSGNLILNSDKIAQSMAAERIEEILRCLGKIDSGSISTLRAVLAETATDEYIKKLSGFEVEA